MKQKVEAVFESGIFRLIQPNSVQLIEGQNVRLLVLTMENNNSVDLEFEQAKFFRDELRKVRIKAFENAEDYQGILFAIERFGSYLTKKADGTLNAYQKKLEEIAINSTLSGCNAKTFNRLYGLIQSARNDALHQGAFARHLTYNLVKISLILEDALETKENFMKVEDFMIQNPIGAELWQPLNFIRQQMLVNQFSYLPFKNKDCWCLVSDYDIASYLRIGGKRKEKLSEQLQEALDGINFTEKLNSIPAEKVVFSEHIKKTLEISKGEPVLVFQDNSYERLVGIITPFDIL